MSEWWKGKRVLVTGAGGFIGSHLVERLLDLGADVTAFVRYNAAGSRGLLDRLPLQDQERVRIVVGDLCEPDALDDAMRDQEIVFHLAAIIAIPFSYLRPAQVIENNVRSTLNVLQAARRFGIQRIVHTSSSEVYGTARVAPIDEDHPLQAQSPYAASKIACDKIAQSFHLSYDLPVVTLRPFNTYGPRQSARAIVPTIITQALTSKRVYLGAMHPTRDLTFVSDTVEGFIRIAEAPNVEGRTYHIGTGIEISVGELADRIVRLIGSNIPILFDPTRIRPPASEVARLICDASRARRDLGWEPKVSLDEGLQRTIEWIGQNLAAYRADIYNI
ncbi:MAG: SDR family NAD(P)-dependent oxidoreductase [Candidatus Hydrogenedentota bacterium]|jgi:dTDP-glucose 4,6-dehydratase|nr:SDR family NAD(P)-dependent oxidoreductase [Candidatus Sumerlaea chitinivorans]RMH28054.1 MAG: SDR family NAD(P)-dependent oxidoreductase [Candidatus Hydrogenedentota bacterium]GIX45243.1 MAG: NAD-dependent dehydratase [Candidatus Sumerlaea sp.]